VSHPAPGAVAPCGGLADDGLEAVRQERAGTVEVELARLRVGLDPVADRVDEQVLDLRPQERSEDALRLCDILFAHSLPFVVLGEPVRQSHLRDKDALLLPCSSWSKRAGVTAAR
jgi:hypothetical protein